MHLAIVIESTYGETPQLPELSGAHASAELVSQRLERAGFRVERVPGSRDLPTYLDDRLLEAPTPFQSLIVYYIGYVALNPGRGPALLLDGPRVRAFPVGRLARAVMSASYSGALVVDAVGVLESDQTVPEIAGAIADVVPQEGRVSTIVAIRGQNEASAWMPSRMSDLFAIGLDWLESTEADAGAITLRKLIDVMREERIAYSRIGWTAEQFSEDEFMLLPARVALRPSAPVRRAAPPEPSKDSTLSWAPKAPASPALPVIPEPLAPPPAMAEPERPEPAAENAPLPSFERDSVPPESDAPLPPYGAAADVDGPLPSFDDPELASSGVERELESTERSSVLPSPAARRESAQHSGHDRETLAEMIAGYDRAGQHAEAVGAREELAALLEAEPESRAYLLEQAARIAANRLNDSETAVRLALAALDVDPTAVGALELVSSELGRAEAWQALCDAYAKVLVRLSDGPIAARLASHLGAVLQTRVGDLDRAVKAYERALACDPTDATLHARLADIHEVRGETMWAIRRRRAEAKAAPTSPKAFATALTLFGSAGDIDGAWNAAAALVALDAADDRAQALYELYRDGGLLRVQRGLTQGDWTSGLLHPDRDPEVIDVLGTVERAASRARLDHLARTRSLVEFPDSARHDPEKSTTMLARSLLWTSKLLGIGTPHLYVVDGAPGHMVPVPAPDRTSVVSRSLGSGLALGELSFLWARHLTFQRREHRLLTFYPTAKDLTNLLVAAKAVGSETRAVDFLDGEAKEIAKALRRALDPAAHRVLVDRVRVLGPAHLESRAVAWARGVECVAGRVGLLACGDIAVASRLVARFPMTGLLTPEEQADDLLAYSISAEYGELRSRLGAQVRDDARQAG